MKKITAISALMLLALALTALVACSRPEPPKPPVLGVDSISEVAVFEEPTQALASWARQGLKGMTVVHASATGALGVVPPEHMERLRRAHRAGKLAAVLKAEGDQGASGLIGRHNYITAAAALGIVSRVYWVLPENIFEAAGASAAIRDYLTGRSSNIYLADEIGAMQMQGGCLAGNLNGTEVAVCSPATMHLIKGPVILDINLNGITEYMPGMSRLRAFKEFFDALALRKYPIASASVSLDTEGGTTGPHHRHLGYQAAEVMRNPEMLGRDKPPELWMQRDIVQSYVNFAVYDTGAQVMDEMPEALRADPHLKGMEAVLRAMTGQYDRGLKLAEAACAAERADCAYLVMAGRRLSVSDDEAERAEAGRYFKSALTARPGWALAQREYGMALMRIGAYDEAAGMLKQSVEIEDTITARLRLGDLGHLLKRPGESATHYRRALELNAKYKVRVPIIRQNARSLLRAALVLQEAGDEDAAAIAKALGKHIQEVLGPPRRKHGEEDGPGDAGEGRN